MAKAAGIHNVTDVIRGTFIIDRPEQADAIIQELAKRFEVVAEDWKVTALNYADRTLNVRLPSGMVGEILIMDAAMAAASEAGHALKVEGRNLARALEADPGNAELTARLEDVYARSRNLYGKVLASYPPEWREAFGLD